MNRLRLVLAILLLGACLGVANAQEELITFSRSDFAGWTYVNNAGIELNAQEIGRGRILLYTVAPGNIRELISPTFDCQNADSLLVKIIYRPVAGADYHKLFLRVALTDVSDGNESVSLVSVPGELPDTQVDYEVITSLEVPDGDVMHQLHFTAPMADADNCAAVMEVHVFATSHSTAVHGDVTGDGLVDVEDVNAIINIILKINTASDFTGDANVNGEGIIDVEDVNEVINIILKANNG